MSKNMRNKSKSIDDNNHRTNGFSAAGQTEIEFWRIRNSELSKALADAQIENARLQKLVNNLHEDKCETHSKYNHLKNVISKIDFVSRQCINKTVELTEKFTGILQLCTAIKTVGTKDITITQAVKPQIVNGHVLHSPTITLTRLSRSLPNEEPAPAENNEDNMDVDSAPENPGASSSFTSRRSVAPKVSLQRFDMSKLNELEDEEPEEPDEPANSGTLADVNSRLHTIEEENEDVSPIISSGRNGSVLSGVFQEVKIYLNQLPIIDNSNKSELETRSLLSPASSLDSTSSVIAAANDTTRFNLLNETLTPNSPSVEKILPKLKEPSPPVPPRRRNITPKKLSSDESTLNENSQFSPMFPINSSQAPSSVNSDNISEDSLNTSKTSILKHLGLSPKNLTNKTSTPLEKPFKQSLRNLRTSFNNLSRINHPNSKTNTSELDSSKNLNVPRTPNRSNNVTKRRGYVEPKRKMPMVILNRLSLERRLSGSPNVKLRTSSGSSPFIARKIKRQKISSSDDEDDVTSPNSSTLTGNVKGLIKKSVETTEFSREADDGETDSNEKRLIKTSPKKMQTSPTKRLKGKSLRKMQISPSKGKVIKSEYRQATYYVSSPMKRSPAGRPKRSARPICLTEPSLNKKMRR